MKSIILCQIVALVFVSFIHCGFGDGETQFLVSGSILTDICTSAQSLVQSGLAKDQIHQILLEKFYENIGLNGQQRKLGNAGKPQKHEEEPEEHIEQHGMINVNAKDIFNFVMGLIHLERFHKCQQSSEICSSIVFPDQINLADQQQVQALFEKLSQIKNSLINCEL